MNVQPDVISRLQALLGTYDQANRLLIDQCYGQLSPTLDDFYEERLRLQFAEGSPEVAPTITLSRVIPAGPTRIARNLGAPFPLAAVHRLVSEAAELPTASSRVVGLAHRIASGEAELRPRQVGRTQRVIVEVHPDRIDLASFLA